MRKIIFNTEFFKKITVLTIARKQNIYEFQKVPEMKQRPWVWGSLPTLFFLFRLHSKVMSKTKNREIHEIMCSFIFHGKGYPWYAFPRFLLYARPLPPEGTFSRHLLMNLENRIQDSRGTASPFLKETWKAYYQRLQ